MLFTRILSFSYNVTTLNCVVKGCVCSTQRHFNPFPNKSWFLRVCRTILLKTQREKEKLLVMSNFSFSHSVFYLFGVLSAIFKCNSSPDKKILLFYMIQTVFYIIQYTQFHSVNICSFGVIKLQNPNLHLSSYTPPLSQPFNP